MATVEAQSDVIVVGAGPAGLITALELASNGLEVLVMERGQYPGSKNVSGLLYSTVLSEVMPDFANRAPLERPVCKRAVGVLDEEGFVVVEFGSSMWREPPHNNSWVVYRAKFDRWLASEVEARGATILEGTVVDDLVYEEESGGKKVVGVKVRGEEEPFGARVVVLAEGALGILTEKARRALGMSLGARPQSYGIGIKEIWGLESEKIEDRFRLSPGCGAAIEWVGSPFRGLVGGGFMYTGQESIALGAILKVNSLVARGISPHEVMEAFKGNPEVRRYLEGGELLEYSAHLVPEGGYEAIGDLCHDGLVVIGDAAGLVNASMYHEGGNLAMLSGKLAAEAIIQAKLLGDFSKATLSIYEKMLLESFAAEDLRALRGLEEAHEAFPRLMDQVPRRLVGFITDIYRQASMSKKNIRRQAVKRALRGLPKMRIARDLWKARRLLG